MRWNSILVDREAPRGRDASSRPFRPVTGNRPWDIQVYGLRELDDFEPFFRDVYAHGRGDRPAAGIRHLGIRARASWNWACATARDALQACDEAVKYKRLVKGVAVRHGFEATFMAKPHSDIAGSGMHLHVSLANPDGSNAFASDDPAGSPLLRQAVGGMQALLNESMAVFAPERQLLSAFPGEFLCAGSAHLGYQ